MGEKGAAKFKPFVWKDNWQRKQRQVRQDDRWSKPGWQGAGKGKDNKKAQW